LANRHIGDEDDGAERCRS